MKIAFLTQDDPLYILPFFEEFFAHYASEFDVVLLAACRVMGGRSRRQMARELTQLYGAFGFLRLASGVAAAKCLQRLPRRAGARRYHGLRQLCRAYGTPHLDVANPNAAEFVADLQARAPDLLISVACPYILKVPILGVAPLGAINVHHAPLPRYKGMMPTFWQMFGGENSVGVTVHRMTPRLDEGFALVRDQLPIAPGERLHQLIRRSKRHGAHCVAAAARRAARGEAGEPLTGEASYFTFPKRAEIRAFRAKGLRAI